MWRAGPGGDDVASGSTWRVGPPRRYDVALRPCGRTRVAHAGGAPSGREATWAPVWGATCRGVERICYDS